jgi:4-alpha-glucanotransferase
VDVWAHREVFCLDEDGRRRVVAGVPPDYFCADGQLWGNPLYRWSMLEETQFAWWLNRFRTALSRFDALRLDHFLGFVRFWEVPGDSPTARVGRYVEVPGEKFLEATLSATGFQPFLAEDLGVVTPEVHALRARFSLPGMRILLFAFDDPDGSDYLPHRYERNTAVYTGTHDNDTAMGWFHAPCPSGENAERHRAARTRALEYLGSDGHEFHWALIRSALASIANTAIVPVQDLLGLGSDARMNVPGTTVGNWAFRLLPGELSDAVGARLRKLSSTYERLR